MAKFSYLPENKRCKIIHLKEEGYSMRQIAAKVPCGLSTVVRTLKKFSETNFIADRGRSGRPRKTSLREDRLLHRISLSNRKLNSSQILKQWTLTSNVSVRPRTVRGRLLEIGLRGCKARPKPLLTEFQRKSDESHFCISGNQSSAYIRQRTHEEFSPQCLKPTVKYPTKVMVWSCMSSHGVGRLHIISGTVKAMDYIEILQNKLLPTARDLFGNQSLIFQDDNAPCHRAKHNKDNPIGCSYWNRKIPRDGVVVVRYSRWRKGRFRLQNNTTPESPRKDSRIRSLWLMGGGWSHKVAMETIPSGVRDGRIVSHELFIPPLPKGDVEKKGDERKPHKQEANSAKLL
ncbi:transposable element Tcb1 transposase [Trichonephila clavipes]|nr:transposable element Tcb1 transposase [Trichonephila clavipes]